jgi:hypothetical protein
MGTDVRRVLFSFDTLVGADTLAASKVRTNTLEAGYQEGSTGAGRPVNLDPGYMEQSKVVVASTKNYYHRIYLGSGVFGELAMYYQSGAYRFLPWTYPEYQGRIFQDFFIEMRRIYRSQLKNRCLITRQEDNRS